MATIPHRAIPLANHLSRKGVAAEEILALIDRFDEQPLRNLRMWLHDAEQGGHIDTFAHAVIFLAVATEERRTSHPGAFDPKAELHADGSLVLYDGTMMAPPQPKATAEAMTLER
jgi:hypothetical protein